VTGNPWFKRGTLFRHALEALRTATAPMTVKEITDTIVAAKGIADATDKQRLNLESGVRASLETNAGKTVERVGEGTPKRWRVT
jgi:hypothetical protein